MLETDDTVAVSAVAGSGKTTLLVEISKHLPDGLSLYLAYNRSIANEASRKFPKHVACMTTHSLAYRAIVVQNNFKVSNFISFKDVEYIRSFDYFMDVMKIVKDFCLSIYTDIDEFLEHNFISPIIGEYVIRILTDVTHGNLPCTHEMYLKFYHMALDNGSITYEEPFTIIMLDEAGDLNPVTLEVFKLLPTKKKILVGDPYQNIYAFNQTINGFEEMHKQVTKLPMTKSFRVSTDIAMQVEYFCKKHLDKDFHFEGTELKDMEIRTKAYITRTNSALVSKMLELNAQGIQYNLIRSPDDIFKLPLLLCRLRPGEKISDSQYSHFEEDLRDWSEEPSLQSRYKAPLAYLKALYTDDVAFQIAATLVLSKGARSIIECHKEAKKHVSRTHSLTLGTAHSCKGLTTH